VLEPLEAVLDGGNQAMRWLARHAGGESIAAILADEAAAMVHQEEAARRTLASGGPAPIAAAAPVTTERTGTLG
jgi:hypothetical protein